MSHNFLPTAYLQGQFLSFADAKISIATQALHYGTAAFGGMRGLVTSEGVTLFRLDRHCDRLARSSKFFNYDISSDFIRSKIIEFIKLNKPTENFYIRPLVYVSDLGTAPRLHDVEKDLLIYGLSMGDYLNPAGVSCRFSSWIRQEDRAVPLRGKIAGTYTMAAMAKTEAVKSGFDEALIFNSQGKVCEASAMNLFLVRDGQLITPSVDQDILEGITRASVIELAKFLNIPITERPVDKSELLIADEVFFTGTAGKITPVKRIENYNLGADRPITNEIKNYFEKILKGESLDFDSWLTKITY